MLQIDKGTENSLSDLSRLDNIKIELLKAKQAIQEADKWTLLANEIEDVSFIICLMFYLIVHCYFNAIFIIYFRNAILQSEVCRAPWVELVEFFLFGSLNL